MCYIGHVIRKSGLYGEYRTGGPFDPPAEITIYMYVCIYRKSGNFRGQNFSPKKFEVEKFLGASVYIWKLKTPIVSIKGKILLLATTWKIMEELRRELYVRGHHIYKEVWNPAIGARGGAMQQGASKCGGSIFCCHQDDSPLVWSNLWSA